MAPRWTVEQVLGLAPDAASAAAGRKLATPSSWPLTGSSDRAVWGLAQGSGKKPYQAAVDLSGPAWTCSCPSRKIPCKHVLGLLLMWADGRVPDGTPEAFVKEWIEARSDRAEAAVGRAAERAERAADPVARARRADRRSAAVRGGLEDLERLLGDLVRQGLAAARERPASMWDDQARRLVDAQAPALAARVRALGATLHSGRHDWPQDALRQSATLHLATRAWLREDAVPGDLRDDLRAFLGWAHPRPTRDEGAAPQAGPWAVVGTRMLHEERLRIRRTWLIRTTDRRPALVLDFAAAGAGLEAGYLVGTIIDATLLPYPGRSGLRVVADGAATIAGAWGGPDERATIAAALDAWGSAVARDPFVERVPLELAGVVPLHLADDEWVLMEPHTGTSLPFEAAEPWSLVSLAGGHPVGVAGEWDGCELRVLSAHDGGRTWPLESSEAVGV